MKITILTLFPDMFLGPFSHSIIKRAIDNKKIRIEYVYIRAFGIGKHQIVDDTPYGGGAGMLLRVDVLDSAVESARCKTSSCKEHVILMDAGGETFSQQKAKELTTYDHLIIICGHYEGIDERITHFIDEDISIGDFVLTGGEIPAMVVVDTVVRLRPTILGNDESSAKESFQTISDEAGNKQLLEYPQYTKPIVYKNIAVPEVLLSGHHANITGWRKEQAKKRTLKKRPDLLK